MTYSVLICDDDPKESSDWLEKLCNVAPTEHYTVRETPTRIEVRDAIREVFARQCAMLKRCPRMPKDCLFDRADILILDYDLLYIDEANARHTGESLARLVRTFSKVEVVVVYNQFPGPHFDLSLRGHLSSHADLNLRADLLDTPGLWTDPPWNGFRPWHWQTLHLAVETQRARQRLVRDHFEDPIVEVLGMCDEDFLRLSDTAVGFIAPNARDWGDVCKWTFRKWTLDSFAGRPTNGLSASVLLEADEEAAYRFTASRVGKWLERQVLGPQDVLVDLPHLILRFPFLLGDDLEKSEVWTAAVWGGEEVKSRVPQHYLFQPANVLSRPVVWASRLLEQAGFRESRASFDYSNVPPLVFLEDTSAFEPFEGVRQFRAGHHNAYDRRFIKCVADKDYAPQRRLAFVG